MTTRPRVLAILLAAAAPAGPALAAPAPACAREEVLRIVAAELGRRALYATIVPGSVLEATAPDGDGAACAVLALNRQFGAAGPGTPPLDRWRVVRYSVRPSRNGVFVRLDG